MTFINNTFDTVDDDELAAALALKSDKNETYTKTQVNNNFQPTGDYALTSAVALKADQSDVALKADQSVVALKADQSDVDSAMALKADQSDVALKADQSDVALKADQSVVDTAMALKADQSSVDTAMALKADQSDVDTAMALKADQSDVALKADQSDVDTAMALKADQSSVDTAMALKADQSDVDTAMALKADQSDVALKADQSDVDTAMALKADQSDVDTSLNLKQDKPSDPADSFALVSDIPALSGGYTTSQIDGFLADKAEVDDVYTKTQSDSNYLGSVTIGSVNTLPAYDLNAGVPNQASVVNTGTGNEAILDFFIPQGFTGAVGATGATGGGGAKGDTGDKGDKGDTGSAGSAGIVDAVALAIAVSSHITSMSLPTATDFTDMGSDIATLTDNKVSKPSDWSIQSQYPETELNPYTLQDYVYEKVRFNNKLDKATVLDIGKTGDSTQVNFNAKHTKINADDVNIGASVVPAGYKLIVDGGDTRIQNGTSKYLDLANDKVGIRTDADLIDLGCDVKIVGSTCIEGDLKVSGVLKNGADKPYILQEDHDDDITTITDILTDITDAIPTDENGNNEIPANEKLAYKSQITGLQTQVDNLNYPTIENVDDLFDARLQSVGVVDDNLALLHYDKTEVDALIPDVSEYETTAQLDTRLADYTTISLFEAHENLMELELAGKADTTAIPDVSGFALSSAIPDVSSFITNSTNSLANYDTSTEVDNKLSTALTSYDTSGEVDTKIANASSGGGGGGSWEEGTGGDIYYTGGDVSIGATTSGAKLTVIGSGNANISAGDRRFFDYDQYVSRGSVQINYNYGNWSFASIYADGDITTGGFLAAVGGTLGASDERIKKEIVDVEDGSALDALRLLKPKKYKYVDEVQRGSEPVWGFIAQQVRETLPYATQSRTECLPNIYELANVSASNVITFTNFDTSNLESNAMVLKVYDVDDTEHLVNITEVIDGHSIRVDEVLTEWTEDDKIFVYGQRVDDFHFLKKDAIWTVATSALQEVDRQLQVEKAKVTTLETQLTSVLARLDALESA